VNGSAPAIFVSHPKATSAFATQLLESRRPIIITSLPGIGPGKARATFCRAHNFLAMYIVAFADKRPESGSPRSHTPPNGFARAESMAVTSPDCRAHGVLLHPPVCKNVVTFFTAGHPAIRAAISGHVCAALFQRKYCPRESLDPTWNKPGIRAKLLDVVLNSLVETGNQRRNQHDHADAQHTPNTVSPLRILCVRNVSIACLRFSPYACAILPSR